jgi:hypothetical protein
LLGKHRGNGPRVSRSSQVGFIRFFEPFKHLRCGDRPFRQMRIERARPDILGFGRFSSREFLGLSLVRKRFGRPCVRSFSRSQFKRDVPRAFGLASHDETLSPLRRRLAVGDKPKLLRILHIAQRDLRDLNRRRPDSFRAASDPDHPPALRIRFPRWPRGQKSLGKADYGPSSGEAGAEV